MFLRLNRPFLYGLCGILVAALALLGAYTLGTMRETRLDEEHVKELERENARLKQGEEDAAVDRRVSEQMAEIARDQRLLSDAQRDSAEKQRTLAEELRAEAQRESQAARAAEAQANTARREAEAASEEAKRERSRALLQEEAALRSKRATDTLRYRDLARLLGSRSLLARESGNDSLARKLAYTAWYFLSSYGNNVYQPEVFQALGYDDKMEASSPHHSAIYDVDKSVDGKSCIVCTGYGEVLRWRGGKVETLFFDKRYDLRSMVQEPDAVWTLSFDGHLLHISATGKQQQMEDFVLPEGEYFHLQDLPEGRLLAGARHQVVIFDIKTRSILTVRPFPEKRLLTTMPTKKEVFFFYDNGTIGRTPYSTKRNSEVPHQRTHHGGALRRDFGSGLCGLRLRSHLRAPGRRQDFHASARTLVGHHRLHLHARAAPYALDGPRQGTAHLGRAPHSGRKARGIDQTQDGQLAPVAGAHRQPRRLRTGQRQTHHVGIRRGQTGSGHTQPHQQRTE